MKAVMKDRITSDTDQVLKLRIRVTQALRIRPDLDQYPSWIFSI